VNISACLHRIGYRGPVEVSARALHDLHHAFLLAVPFENLDIHIGRRIRIESDRVFEKVVENRRGGFCYELNGLFHDLLEATGYKTTFLAARMMRGGEMGREFGHMTLRVDLDDAWLVDVGNGKAFRSPLRLDGSNETWAEDIGYRVRGETVQEKLPGADWQTRYVFSLTPRTRAEFEEACDWTQTSPKSIFTQNRMCTLARETGRVTLMNDLLTVADERGSQESRVAPESLGGCLEREFGIKL
jgi:N-hydroxyarylamine O-acetyltransferase